MKRAVLLLHGWLSDIHDYDLLVPELARIYDYIERFTYVGHGVDADPRDFNLEETFLELEKCFINLQKNYEIIDVIGFSMGGALATYLSNRFAFNKLVLLAPANKYFNLKMPFSKARHLLSCIYNLDKANRSNDIEKKEYYKSVLKNTFEDDMFSIRFAFDNYITSHFRHSFRVFRNVVGKANENLMTIENPCFIAIGKLDQLVPLSSAIDLYNLCTNDNKVIKVYNDLSHTLIYSTNNKELINDVIEFLKK